MLAKLSQQGGLGRIEIELGQRLANLINQQFILF